VVKENGTLRLLIRGRSSRFPMELLVSMIGPFHPVEYDWIECLEGREHSSFIAEQYLPFLNVRASNISDCQV
jgi:hypothetical protein